MGEKPIVEDTKSKLKDLEQRIDAAKSSLGPADELATEAKQDWDRMVRAHADLTRELEKNSSAQNLESVRLDVDVLSKSFEGWMARVESRFSKRPS
jgi:hypothetical protein